MERENQYIFSCQISAQNCSVIFFYNFGIAKKFCPSVPMFLPDYILDLIWKSWSKYFYREQCEGLTVVIMVVGVGCAMVVVTIDSLSCLLSWFCTLVECWLNYFKDQYETACGTMIVHESRTAGEPGTRSIERPILSLNPRNRVPG